MEREEGEVKADNELIEYIKLRYQDAKSREEIYEPHGDDRFKHIYYMGVSSAFKELLMILEDKT